MSGMTKMTAATQYCNQDGKEYFGDFMRNEDEEMDLKEVLEPWDKSDKRNTPDVFYPIRLGDLINERYLVEHKLGSGGFSTVWMAHDRQNNRDVVALKIMFAGELGEREIRLQDEIVQNVRDALDHLPRSAKYEALGRPLKQMIPVDNLWKQGELVGPVKIPQSLHTKKFYLGDFGLAKKVTP